jgi:polysaccharide pyruvyl transferase WcaK-like protein
MKHGAVADFFRTTDLERSLLIGFYGGGNFGDELLLEVLLNKFSAQGHKHVQIYYQDPERYATFHHDFGYDVLDARTKPRFLKQSLKSRNVIIGGGGLWGLDVNWNILLLSMLLVLYRFVFRKKVYLLGVGFYSSTGKLGRLSAWLAAKAAHRIIVRDEESFGNFTKLSGNVQLDQDLAWQLAELDLTAYQADLLALEQNLKPPQSKTLFITLRRFQSHQKNPYTETVEATLAQNPDKPIIVSLLEPRDVDPEGYERLQAWQRKHPHIHITDFAYNPLALYLYMKKYHDRLLLIAPQFHAIITAHLAGVPCMPMSYDNKVSQLLRQIAAKPLPIASVNQTAMQRFIDLAHKEPKQ